MDRDGLADFLRRKREALAPEDVGLPPGRRRRTAGLRREEVASLAHMSTDFYTRLEQRRGSRPSQETVAAIARALRLTLSERDHLYALAGHVAPPRVFRTDHVSPGLARVLDQLDTPAQIVSDLGVVLRQNALAVALLGEQTKYEGHARSVIYRWFTDPAERRRFADEERTSRSYVASLRSAYRADDAEANALVDALKQASPEFAERWSRHEVAERTDTLKRIVHPSVGTLTLDCQVLTAENRMEKLVVFTAAPGSQDAEKLRLLAVIGAQTFV